MAVDLAALDPHSARTVIDELGKLARDYPGESQTLRHVSTDDPALNFAREPDILAYSITTGEHQGIYFNAHAIAERVEQPSIGVQEARSGWTVPGGGSLKGIVSHEFGELLADRIISDAALRAELNRAVSRTLGAPYDAADPHGPELLALISTHLSTYGATTPHDLVAEAFTEYRTAPGPRALAMEIGRLIDRHLAGDRPVAEVPRQADVLEPLHARRREPAGDQPGRALTRWRALNSAIREASREKNTTPLVELQQYVIQRALARVFTQNPRDWMLKGGQSMLARIPDARPSSDIDLVRLAGGLDVEVMAADYTAALELDHGDGLRFVLESTADLKPGIRMRHIVMLGDMELMRLGADLNPARSRPLWREPDIVPFPDSIHDPSPGSPRPDLRIISLQDMLAHKVSGMYNHGRRTLETKCDDCVLIDTNRYSCVAAGDLPHRAQDLADVLLMAYSMGWDGPETHAILHEEMQWRLDQGFPQLMPDRFEVPNPDWRSKFEQYAMSTARLPITSLDESLHLAARFLDPLLGPGPLLADWDPERLVWVEREAGPETDAHGNAPRVTDPVTSLGVRQIAATGRGEPSPHHAEPEMIARWEALAAGRDDPRSLDAQVERLKERTDIPLAVKIRQIEQDIMPAAGYQLTKVHDLDSKNLRMYVYQGGEIYIHAGALLADPATTIEIAFRPHRTWNTYRWEAHQTHIAYLDELVGITADQANVAAKWRSVKGRPVHGVDPAELASDLLDIRVQPLRDALSMRHTLIHDYGIAPHRVRLAYADGTQNVHYGDTRWVRAHLFALDAIRNAPDEARQAMVESMRGPADRAVAREARVRALIDRLHAANDKPGDAAGTRRKYALLWVRDTRPQPVGGRHGPHLDTRPEFLKQTIETVRAMDPDRRIILLGDDVFARRPELYEQWQAEGVLEGVDTRTLVKFWDAERNGGRRLDLGEQGLFYHHLNAESDIVQVGMLSGALELPALLGVPTVYFDAREHDGNKSNRWALFWQPWAYGRQEPMLGQDGRPLFDDTARPVTTFKPFGAPLPPPLPRMKRVVYGPDLADPGNRRLRPVAIYQVAQVAMTADRVNRLVATGELDHWPKRLGRSTAMDAPLWRSWSADDWARSRYYAQQLHRWISFDATTAKEADHKWRGIRLALQGVVEPDFHFDYEEDSMSAAHPYVLQQRQDGGQPAVLENIARAYDAPPAERPAAVTQVLKDLLDTPGFRERAVADLRLFRLEPFEVQDLRETLASVTAPDPLSRIKPFPLSPDTDGRPPFLERLDLPIAAGEPTPREVIERFDPSRAGLPAPTANEAVEYVAANAEQRPWLAAALGRSSAVQRIVASIDLGKGHFLERHGPFADEAKLQGRVTRLEDPAQLDDAKRAAAVDAYVDRRHACPDTATAVTDLDAFVTLFARAVEHPLVGQALNTPFDPESRPDSVSIPLRDLLGPDGHLYCAGFRLEPVDGSLQRAWDERSVWVDDNRNPGREPTVAEPRSTPVASFQLATVILHFQANRERNGYEIATMFVEPGSREAADD